MNKQEYYAYVKSTTTQIRLTFKGGIAKDITDFAIKKNVSRSKAAYYLLLLALKYNFDSNGKYIPSKLSRSVPCEERNDNIVVSRLNIYFPLNYLNFLETCGKELSCYSHTTAAKKLIAIALNYNCNDALNFSYPQFLDCSEYKYNYSNDFICLDFI